MRQARKRTISKVHVDGNKFSPQEDTRIPAFYDRMFVSPITYCIDV